MRKIIIFLLFFSIFVGIIKPIYAALSLVLVDNTLVTDAAILKELSRGGEKALIVSGSIGDTFEIIEDGVLVKTITLEATSEKWTFNHTSSSYKVNWSAPGTDTATLICAGD